MHAEGEKMGGGIKGNSDGQEGHLGGPGQTGSVLVGLASPGTLEQELNWKD